MWPNKRLFADAIVKLYLTQSRTVTHDSHFHSHVVRVMSFLRQLEGSSEFGTILTRRRNITKMILENCGFITYLIR